MFIPPAPFPSGHRGCLHLSTKDHCSCQGPPSTQLHSPGPCALPSPLLCYPFRPRSCNGFSLLLAMESCIYLVSFLSPAPIFGNSPFLSLCPA